MASGSSEASSQSGREMAHAAKRPHSPIATFQSSEKDGLSPALMVAKSISSVAKFADELGRTGFAATAVGVDGRSGGAIADLEVTPEAT